MQGDEVLIQEIYSLREKLKIATKIVTDNWPEMAGSVWMHSLGTCDFDEYIQYLQEEPII